MKPWDVGMHPLKKQNSWHVRNGFALQGEPFAAQQVELQGEPLQTAMEESAASGPNSSDSGFSTL